jgi:hypothetical protein
VVRRDAVARRAPPPVSPRGANLRRNSGVTASGLGLPPTGFVLGGGRQDSAPIAGRAAASRGQPVGPVRRWSSGECAEKITRAHRSPALLSPRERDLNAH